jgi:hypothetical protein
MVFVLDLLSIAANIVALSFAISLSFALLGYVVDRKDIKKPLLSRLALCFSYSLPLASIAVCAGYLTGTSRLPAVAALLPAALSLLSAVYLWAVNAQSVEMRSAVGCGVTTFALALVLGVFIGSDSRENGRLTRLQNLSEQERSIRLFRENRDLPPDIPVWMLTGEGIYK